MVIDSAERTSEMIQDIDQETLEILIDELSEQDLANSMRMDEADLCAAEEPRDVNSISPPLPSG
ncbi:MAG: SMC-Scp complex subunit ScpB, partial [Pseudomonadota bacterium]|nr:SMC-Scp complex subunit ScpB [Pseudomonadota bacterium]